MTQGYRKLESDARTRARGQRVATGNLYVQNGGSTALTEARAVAEALEADEGETYSSFRQAHNSAHIIKSLRDAGVKFQTA